MTYDDDTEEAGQLQAFAYKREALERLVMLARSLAKLGEGIQSVVKLTQQASSAAPGRVFFDSLSRRLNDMSAEAIVEQLNGLVTKLNCDLDAIVKLARANEDTIAETLQDLNTEHEQSDFEFLDHYLDEFQRRAQLAVALRLYLSQQRIETPGFELTFSVQDLETELDTLRDKEITCRRNVRATVQELIDDADVILANPNYPEALKDQVREMREGLLVSIEHIDAGKDIGALPVQVEEMVIDTPAYGAPEEAPIPPGEAQPEAASDDRETIEEKPPVPETGSAAPGILATLWVWLNTPTKVSWSEARDLAGRNQRH